MFPGVLHWHASGKLFSLLLHRSYFSMQNSELCRSGIYFLPSAGPAQRLLYYEAEFTGVTASVTALVLVSYLPSAQLQIGSWASVSFIVLGPVGFDYLTSTSLTGWVGA